MDMNHHQGILHTFQDFCTQDGSPHYGGQAAATRETFDLESSLSRLSLNNPDSAFLTSGFGSVSVPYNNQMQYPGFNTNNNDYYFDNIGNGSSLPRTDGLVSSLYNRSNQYEPGLSRMHNLCTKQNCYQNYFGSNVHDFPRNSYFDNLVSRSSLTRSVYGGRLVPSPIRLNQNRSAFPSHIHNVDDNEQSYKKSANIDFSRRLEDINCRSYCYSLDQCWGWIRKVAKDQHGSRFLQRMMESVGRECIKKNFFELKSYFLELALHPFGNYAIQKLVEVCSQNQRTSILMSIARNSLFTYICVHELGNRVVQKLLVHISTHEQELIVWEPMIRGVVALCKDSNGHRVIELCLNCFSDENVMLLLNEVADNCFEIATDKSGCCILPKLIEHSQAETRNLLLVEIISNALPLSEDRYGNYIMQYTLKLGMPHITASILEQLQGRHVHLACNKCASNVVELCLKASTPELASLIITELLRDPHASSIPTDPYGNYVFQEALRTAKKLQGSLFEQLCNLVRSDVMHIRNNMYGKMVMSCMEKLQHI